MSGGEDETAMASEVSGGTRRTAFLSYTRDERPRALEIITVLERQGIDVWWDGLLAGGDRFAETTEHALETCDAVVVLWSEKSLQSHWVRDEATRGRDRGCMVSISLDGSEPPLGFRQIQYIDLSGWSGKPDAPQVSAVLQAIDHVADHPGTELTFGQRAVEPARQGATRRGVLLAGGAAILVAGGGLAVWRGGFFERAASANSIAVMPFENLSGDAEQAYFSDGLSEELRTTLSLNPQIAVAAQTSSNSFREKEVTADEIATALGVAFILEGSVRRSTDAVRITTRMIDGTSGFQTWSEAFERPLENVLQVQREIASKVVDSLVSTMADGGAAGTVRIGGTSDADALDAFLKGAALYDLAASEQTDRQALAEFERAIERDPEYAAAHAARSRALTVIGSAYTTGAELEEYFERSMMAAQRAVELAPELAEGHSALGFVLTNGRLDIAAAREPYRKSFELGFGNAAILSSFAIFAGVTASFDDARDALARAERLDPLNPSIYRTEAIVEFAARNYPAAGVAAERALSMNGRISNAHRILGDIALLEGQIEAAREHYEAETTEISALPGLIITTAKLDGAEAGERAFSAMVERFGDNSLYQQAQVLAQWGRTDDALEALERGYAGGDAGMPLMYTNPLLDPIRQTPRFAALSRTLGFE